MRPTRPRPSGPSLVREPVGRVLAVGLVGALGAVPAQVVAAPTIASPEKCLRLVQSGSGQLVAPGLQVVGSGFTPGATVQVRRDVRALDVAADAEGGFRTRLSVVDLLSSDLPRVRTVSVSARERGTAVGSSNTVRVRVAPLAFSVTPERARADARVTFRFSGFPPGRVVHAHYLYGTRHRISRPIARAAGPCGTAHARRVQIPLPRPEAGTWTVQFDTSARYRPHSRPQLRGVVEVYPIG